MHADDGDSVPAPRKGVLCVVERSAAKPMRALDVHPTSAGSEHLSIWRMRPHPEVVPERRPEARDVPYRPAPKFLVALKTKTARFGEPPLIVGETRTGLALIRRRPKQCSLTHCAAGTRLARRHIAPRRGAQCSARLGHQRHPRRELTTTLRGAGTRRRRPSIGAISSCQQRPR